MKKIVVVVAIAMALLSGCGQDDDGLVDTLVSVESTGSGLMAMAQALGCAVGSEMGCSE
jgi:hypothetical protein